MKGHRSLVMGGAGFLGSHLCDALVQKGDHVVALDDLSTGSLANLAHLTGHPRFTFFEHDVREAFHLPVDRIYNLACPASPVHYQLDPIKTTLTSVLGTLHAMRLAEACGARVFLASTSEVYGDPEVHPQPEAYRGSVNTLGIRACYDEGKRCAETLAADFARSRGVEVRIARIFNTYGPRMACDDGRVVSNLIIQALSGRELTIYGSGFQTRSFCYVDDLIEGIRRLMDSEVTEPVNLGNPSEFTVLDLAKHVLELTGSASPLTLRPLPEDDPKMRRPEIGRARRLLGFEPRVPLRDGLIRTIDWFRAALARRPAPTTVRGAGRQAAPANIAAPTSPQSENGVA